MVQRIDPPLPRDAKGTPFTPTPELQKGYYSKHLPREGSGPALFQNGSLTFPFFQMCLFVTKNPSELQGMFVLCNPNCSSGVTYAPIHIWVGIAFCGTWQCDPCQVSRVIGCSTMQHDAVISWSHIAWCSVWHSVVLRDSCMLLNRNARVSASRTGTACCYSNVLRSRTHYDVTKLSLS